MTLKLISSTILIFTTSVLAQDVSVYKWVDEDGISHFSHSHPADMNASLVNVSVDYTPAEIIEQQSSNSFITEQANADLQQQIVQSEEHLKLIDNSCKSAQANKKVLTNFKKVMVLNDDGSETLLTGDELTAQVAITDKHIQAYCLNGS